MTAISTVVQWLAAPGLALFCRTHSDQDYYKKNLFCAVPYAWRATALPLAVAKMQRESGTRSSPHRRIEASSWKEYDASRARELAGFVAAASCRLSERPPTVEAFASRWSLVECIRAAEFWAVYRSADSDRAMFDGDGAIVVAFRGGDGGTEDAKHHPGSPARAFIEGGSELTVPSAVGHCTSIKLFKTLYFLERRVFFCGQRVSCCADRWLSLCSLQVPVELLRALASVVGPSNITLVGYSLGELHSFFYVLSR